MATDGQRKRLATLETGLLEHVKAWCLEHNVSANELIGITAALPMQAMLDCGKTADEVREVLEAVLCAVLNTEKIEAREAINTRAPCAIEGGN